MVVAQHEERTAVSGSAPDETAESADEMAAKRTDFDSRRNGPKALLVLARVAGDSVLQALAGRSLDEGDLDAKVLDVDVHTLERLAEECVPGRVVHVRFVEHVHLDYEIVRTGP